MGSKNAKIELCVARQIFGTKTKFNLKDRTNPALQRVPASQMAELAGDAGN